MEERTANYYAETSRTGEEPTGAGERLGVSKSALLPQHEKEKEAKQPPY